MNTVFSVNDLNRALRDDAAGYIRACDRAYTDSVRLAAETILAHAEERPVVLLSGPSGSGKTTTARKIEAFLDAAGHEAHTLSMDNFYAGMDKFPEPPLDDRGNIDYESPVLLDLPLLQKQLVEIAKGLPVELPTYDFTVQRRAKETIPLKRKPGEIIILEGIHALNPEITGDAEDLIQTVFVCPEVSYSAEDLLIGPERVRLMRRMLRDIVGRGQTVASTADRYLSVERGERLYIRPWTHRAQIRINTSIPYEPAVYTQLLPALIAEDRDDTRDLAAFLRLLEPVAESQLASDALIQEFVAD